jgi:hypothetical protein
LLSEAGDYERTRVGLAAAEGGRQATRPKEMVYFLWSDEAVGKEAKPGPRKQVGTAKGDWEASRLRLADPVTAPTRSRRVLTGLF